MPGRLHLRACCDVSEHDRHRLQQQLVTSHEYRFQYPRLPFLQ